jgi:glutamyl-tRNA synthetase
VQRRKYIRTRIAPSPTGFAHVGTAYTALFNFAFAKKHKGQFILRLEDTDVDRNVPGAEQAICGSLEWLGLTWDEGPYRQSERLDLYQKKAEELILKGFAYRKEGAISFKSFGEDMSWTDMVRGEIRFPKDEVSDFVIIKSDGYPTYNFAVVVDDISMNITHVIRGEEHISNTPRQLALYKAFGERPPEFGHLPTLRNEKKQKLSKRRDPVDLRLFRQQGYLPEALVNFLCLLGWSHPEGKEIFSLSEFIDKFDIKRVKTSSPFFDIKKLDWLNGVYIRQKDNKTLAHLVNTYISADVEPEFLEKIVPLIKERINKLSEAESLISFFWKEPYLDKTMFEDSHALLHISNARTILATLRKWSLEKINQALATLIQEKKFKTGDFYMSLRIALTGSRVTPPINESMVILGQDEVLHRLEEAEKVLL